ncbi:MAG TPA: nuclear transport factor 2 family protein [Solirubrobacterales bacterium]|nr:nuclear transport factor 2 family protein [Solirubrobacterales bacterium]
MDDALARYVEASERNDIEAMMETLAPDVELVSPISGHMVFRGEKDVRVLLEAVYGSLKGLRWTDQLGDGDRRVAVGEARLLGVRLTDAMVFDLAPDGRIRRIGPHLRPWLALTLFAIVLVPKVGRRPGMIGRALRAGGRSRD